MELHRNKCYSKITDMFVNGKIAGGIGVGGGTEEQDCAIAEYVVSVFNEVTK